MIDCMEPKSGKTLELKSKKQICLEVFAVTNKSKAINQTFQSLKNLRITSDVKLHTNLFI